MKFSSILLSAVTVIGLAYVADANASFFRRDRVVVNTPDAQVRVRTGGLVGRSRVVVNTGGSVAAVSVRSRGVLQSQRVVVNDVSAARVQVNTPAYVNSQLLIQRQGVQKRFFLNQLNTFDYGVRHHAANVQFVDQGVQYLQAAPIIAAPIIQQYVVPAPVQVAPVSDGCEPTAEAQYSTAPVVQKVVVAPVVQRQVQYIRQPVAVARLESRNYSCH